MSTQTEAASGTGCLHSGARFGGYSLGPVVLAFVVSVVAMWLAPVSARAQGQIELVAARYGAITAFQQVGTRAYCGIGERFVVLDMTNESNIQELGALTFNSPIQCIVVRNSFAFVHYADTNNNPIMVIDVSNPASLQIVWQESPQLVGLIECSVGALVKGQYHGNYLYLGSGDTHRRIMVYDMTNPLNPVALGTTTSLCSGIHGYDIGFGNLIDPHDFTIQGDLMYIMFEDYGEVGIFDLSETDPRSPALIGHVRTSLSMSDFGHRIAVDGTRAIVQVEDSSFNPYPMVVKFIDVGDPVHPVLHGAYTEVAGAHNVAIQGQLAFYTDAPGGDPGFASWDRAKGLGVLDISNLDAPVLIGSYDTTHSCIQDVRVSGNRAYVQCDGQGLVALDLSDPAHPVSVGGYFSPAFVGSGTFVAGRTFKEGSRLYVVDPWNGFEILDVNNSANPQLLGVYRGPGDHRHQQYTDIYVVGDLAYLAAGYGGIKVVNVSNPASPSLLLQHTADSLRTDALCTCIEVDGNVLHAQVSQWGTEGDGCANYSLANSPQSLSWLGTGMPSGGRTRYATKDGITFQGNGSSFYRMNNQDQQHPTMILSSTYNGGEFRIVGNIMYAVSKSGASTTAGLYVYDVTDPLNVSQLTFVPSSSILVGHDRFGDPIYMGNPVGIGVSGSTALIGNNGSVVAFDISNPASPQQVAAYMSGGLDITADGAYAYATNATRGLMIYQIPHAPTCGSADFNCDGDVGTDADIGGFFACLSGDCPAPPCTNSADFNGDGDVGTDADIEAFFRVLAGGHC